MFSQGVRLTPEEGLVTLHNSFCEVIHEASGSKGVEVEGRRKVKIEDPFK